jgi:hypothetical protein
VFSSIGKRRYTTNLRRQNTYITVLKLLWVGVFGSESIAIVF